MILHAVDQLRRFIKEFGSGTSLVIQWLRHHTSTARGMGLIPGWGTKIMQAIQPPTQKRTKCEKIVVLHQKLDWFSK